MMLGLFAVVAVLVPLVMLRSRSLRRCLGAELVTVLAFGGLAAFAHVLRVRIDPDLAFIAFGAIVLTIVCAFVAFAEEVRWSANRAAVFAALFYALMIPLMLRAPIDGDESFYLLMTESLVHDRDLDLGNQFRHLERTASGRTDLVPQLGDRIGPMGSVRSHLEPFLPILMVPGYAIAGLVGALATIALFGALLARSTVRLFEDEGIPDATTRALFPLIAFGPPIVFYAARIWPEVPAAFCFVEAVRGVRQRRAPRWIVAALALVLLKVRFVLVAVPLAVRAMRTKRQAAIAIAIIIVAALIIGGARVHRVRELVPDLSHTGFLGLIGLALDGTAGIAFQAPLYLFGLIALARWRSMPDGFRLGMSSALLYLVALAPRAEWHGGWSPPLRYVVFLMPILALGCASLFPRITAGPLAAITAWTIALVVHGAAFPWRLFHIASGENFVGETLSTIFRSDFSRLFPSFIRPNFAAIVASVLLLIVLIAFRDGRAFTPALAAVIIAVAAIAASSAGGRVEFEDAHVIHRGGELYPTEWQVARFAYRGGWVLRPGESVSFLAKRGPAHLGYAAPGGAAIQLGDRAYQLPPTGNRYGVVAVDVPHDGRIELRCLSGAVNLDWMEHD